MIDICHW